MREVNLADGLYAAVKASLATIPAPETADIYALSLLVYDDEDDPRLPTATLGYNTVSQWRGSIDRASSDGEAKWNYAFWLQNRLECFGEPGTDSADSVRRWIESAGLWYSDQTEEADFDTCLEKGEAITASFVRVCCEAVSRLHSSGDVEETFGREIPIIIHELEYYEQIAVQNEACNPPGAISEFAYWVRSEG